MQDEGVPETSGSLARSAGVSQTTIGNLASEGLLDFVTTRTGMRLFKPGQAKRVQQLIAERAVARGRRAMVEGGEAA